MPPIGYRHREAIKKNRRKKRNPGRRRKTRNNNARKRSHSRSKDNKTRESSKRQRTSVKHKPSCRKNNTGTGRIKISLDDNAQDIQQYLQLQERSKNKTVCCRSRAEGTVDRPVHCRSCRLAEKKTQEETSKDFEEITEECEARSPWGPCNPAEEHERGLQDENGEEMNVLMWEEDIGGEESPFRRGRTSSLKLETCGNAGKLQCGRQAPLICGTVLLIPSILMTLLAFTLYGHPVVPLNILGPIFVCLCFLMIIVGAARQIMSTIEQRRASNGEGVSLANIEEELLTVKDPESVCTLEEDLVLATEYKEPHPITGNFVESAEDEVDSEDDDSDASTEDDVTQTSLVVEALTSSLSTESTVSAEDICFIDETERSDSLSSSEAEYVER